MGGMTYLPSVRIRLTIIGCLLLLVYAGMAWMSQSFVYGQDHHQRPILEFLALYASAFVLYVLALRLLPSSPWCRSDFILILGFAFLFRALLLCSNPIQESDFYRYLWDGKVVVSGLNPYGLAPSTIAAHEEGSREYFQIVASDPTFADILARINHPWVPTIYPPLAQGVFGLAALAAPGSLLGLRLIFLSFDLGICLVMIDIIRRLGRSAVWVLPYAWSPLVIKETVNSAHYDVLPTFFFLAAISCLFRKKWGLAHVNLALATLGKIYPLLLLPFFVWRTKTICGWLRASCGIGVVAVVLFAGYAPFLGAGRGLWQGAAVFVEQWQTNSFLFPLFLTVVQNRWLVNLTVAAVLGGLVVGLLWREDVDDERSFLRRIFVTLGALFLLSPVADPWYFVWLAPFLCVFPSPAWILLSGLLGLYYLSFYFVYQHTGETFRWIVWLEYLPFYSLLLWEWRKGRSTDASSSFTESTSRISF